MKGNLFIIIGVGGIVVTTLLLIRLMFLSKFRKTLESGLIDSAPKSSSYLTKIEYSANELNETEAIIETGLKLGDRD